jgi:hypothetical protein
VLALVLPDFNEFAEGAVVGGLGVLWKTATGKLLLAEVGMETLTAHASRGTGRVAAAAPIEIDRLVCAF